MVKQTCLAQPKVLPTLIDGSLKTKNKIANSALERILHFSNLLDYAFKIKNSINEKEFKTLVNSLTR